VHQREGKDVVLPLPMVTARTGARGRREWCGNRSSSLAISAEFPEKDLGGFEES
jgi:hypothetical protein